MKISFSFTGRYLLIPYSVMEKRPSSTPSGQPSRPKATLSLPECTPSRKRARHRKQHLALACHQGTPSVSDSPTTSAQCPSSNKRQHPKPHTATSHTHKMASVAHCEVEQNTHFDTSPRTPQSRTDMPLAPVDGADHSSATSCCPCTLGRFTVPSLAPVVTFSGISRSFGVSGLPFTAFQLKAISVMFAARMDARLQHGGALSCKPVLLDVDDGVRYSNDSGVQVQGCVGHVSSTCSGGEGSSGVLKEVGDSETCDMHWVKTGRGESELTQQTVEKQTVAATVNNGTKLATNGGIPREMDQGKEKEERRGARPKKHHPDAFVAIRISSSEIRSSLERIQQSITSVESRLGPAMVSLDKLHLTLMVLRLGEEEERIAQAREALSRSCSRIAAHFVGHGRHGAPLIVPFKGVSAFSSSVVFACVDPSETEVLQHLRSVTDIVRSSFLEAGLESTDSRPFAPHLTIAKLSKLPQRKYSKRLRLSKDLYSRFTDEFHGSHAVSELELLSMSRPTTAEGYYHCFARSSWVLGEQVSSDGWEGRGK